MDSKELQGCKPVTATEAVIVKQLLALSKQLLDKRKQELAAKVAEVRKVLPVGKVKEREIGKAVYGEAARKAYEEYGHLVGSIVNLWLPHLFVLGCLMNRRVDEDRAWRVPYKVCDHFNAWTMNDLHAVNPDAIKQYFAAEKLHANNNVMGDIFCLGVERIWNDYGGDASRIWTGGVSSAAVVYRFLQFKGCGTKIATMAANILQRDCGVVFSDLCSIDVSTDVHVMRTLQRFNLLGNTPTREKAVDKAREINPLFPGIIDLLLWEMGRDFCHPKNPECAHCPMNGVCRKVGTPYQGVILVP